MNAYKKWKGIICILAVFAAMLSGCQAERKGDVQDRKEAQKTVYRKEFTEEEKKKGYAEFELMEKVTVRADITPISKYKNGLAKYYMEHNYETTDLKETKEFAENPVLYGKKIPVIMNMLSKKIGGTFEDEKVTLNFYQYDVSVNKKFTGKNGYLYDFYTFWDTGEEEFEHTKQLYCPTMRIEVAEGVNKNIENAVEYDVKKYISDYEETEVSFLPDKQKKGEKLKSFLETLLGRSLNDSWDCIPVTAETIDKLNSIGKESGNLSVYQQTGDEYCAYHFYYDVAGLPYQRLSLNYQLGEDESCSKMAAMSSIDGIHLIGLDEQPQLVYVSEKGILKIATYNFRREGKIYKEAEPVMELEEIISQVQEHYERQIVTEPVIITEIKLVYSGYFTDAADGVIEPAICPFWLVNAYDESLGQNVKFVYDAIDGKCKMEANIAL